MNKYQIANLMCTISTKGYNWYYRSDNFSKTFILLFSTAVDFVVSSIFRSRLWFVQAWTIFVWRSFKFIYFIDFNNSYMACRLEVAVGIYELVAAYCYIINIYSLYTLCFELNKKYTRCNNVHGFFLNPISFYTV